MLHPSTVGNFIHEISVKPARPPLGPIRLLVGEFGRSPRRYHVKKMRVNSFASRKFLSWLCRPTQPLISAAAARQVSREDQIFFKKMIGMPFNIYFIEIFFSKVMEEARLNCSVCEGILTAHRLFPELFWVYFLLFNRQFFVCLFLFLFCLVVFMVLSISHHSSVLLCQHVLTVCL